MYRRLQLLNRFLTDDGAIFVSIDGNELANLLVLMRKLSPNAGLRSGSSCLSLEKDSTTTSSAQPPHGAHTRHGD